MTGRRWIIGSVIAGWVIGTFLVAMEYGWADPVRAVIEGLGRALPAVIISTLTWSFVRLLRRQPVSEMPWLVVHWLVTAVVVAAAFTLSSTQTAQALDPLDLGCPASATFEGNVQTTELHMAPPHEDAQATRLEATYDDGLTRLDCYAIKPSELFGEASYIDILLNLAAQDGVEQEGIFAVEQPVPHSKMLASKFVEDREVVFEYHLMLFDNFVVLAVTAAERSDYPTRRNRTFIEGLTVY